MLLLVAMVLETACDGFRLGRVAKSQRSMRAIKRVTRRKEALQGEKRSCRDKIVQTSDVTRWQSE